MVVFIKNCDFIIEFNSSYFIARSLKFHSVAGLYSINDINRT